MISGTFRGLEKAPEKVTVLILAVSSSTFHRIPDVAGFKVFTLQRTGQVPQQEVQHGNL